MITRFHMENFKSLVDFDLPPPGHELGGFTCLIGLNGSGKSTLLQAFDFVAHVAAGEIDRWLERREWKKGELVSHLGKRSPVINFRVGLRTRDGAAVEWQARFNTNLMKCTAETVSSSGTPVLALEDGRLTVAGAGNAPGQRFESEKVPFEYEGSVMSTMKLADVHPHLAEIKDELQRLCSLELLSPQQIRRKARAANDIGPGGEKLAPFLDQLPQDAKARLLGALMRFYPQLTGWSVKGYRAGWKSLRIHEAFPESGMVEAGHINDGFLRVIAILAQAESAYRFLLFDEIENGINPALVGKLMDFLVDLGRRGKQVMVTTHSPMILNFLDDAVAREGVMLLYKAADGRTQACRYFDQPETGHKLDALGPGEVFVDTDLTRMVDRLTRPMATVAEERQA